MQTDHQIRVEQFMRLAEQEIPNTPTIPDSKVLELRARLIMEECLETVRAMGFDVYTGAQKIDKVWFRKEAGCDLIEVADGCADISVVTIGTLSAFGIKDQKLLEEVDAHNLSKFGPGGYKDEGGKWIKPKDLKKPDIFRAIY